MFEKCGFMDVVSGLWTRLIWIILATVIFAILGVFHVKTRDPEVVVQYKLWESSAIYQVNDQNPLVDKEDRATRMAQTYSALIANNVCYNTVSDFILKKYSVEEIVKKCDLKVPADEYTPFLLKNCIKASSGTAMFSITVTTQDQQLSQTMMSFITDDYMLRDEMMVKDADVKSNWISTVEKPVEVGNLEFSAMSTKTTAAVLGMAGFSLSVIAIIVWCMLFPVINRKSDFTAYGVPVLCELASQQSQN